MKLFRDRGRLRRVIFSLALVGYLVSFFLFLHGAAAMLGGEMERGIVTLLLGFYLLYQVTFLFVVASIIERRKAVQAIPFPDRRRRKIEASPPLPPAPEKAS